MSDAKVLATGLYFGEGPRWHAGRLWFSDFYDHAVKSVDASGNVRTELTIDDHPSGLGWLPDGRLLVVSMNKRQVLRVDHDAVRVHADLSGVAAHRTNDMVVDAVGRAYVGNFGFRLDDELKSRGVEGVLADHPVANLARVDPDGSVHVAAGDLHFPNGSVITPDGRTLIVAETLALQTDGFRHSSGRFPVESPRVGAGGNARSGWDLPGCGRSRLDRECHRTRVRARCPGWRDRGHRKHGSAMLRVHARRRGRQDAIHDDRAVVAGGDRFRLAAGPHHDG